MKEDLLFFIFIAFLGSLFYLLAFFIAKTDLIANNNGFLGALLLFATNFISFITGGIFLILIVSLIVQFFLLFTKTGSGKYDDTLKGVIYSASPVILFIWLTSFIEAYYVLLLLLVWFAVLTFICLSILKDKTNVQSVVVTLLISAVLYGLIYYNYGLSQCLSWVA
ncbi:MAG: hypothetical protein PHV39_03560 [Methanomicrobium sp.]|nr:hypothetical protein [Methanomicrobium sp.]